MVNLSTQISATELQKMPPWIQTFVVNYQALSTDNLHLLNDIYHQGITFIDPMHKIHGLSALTEYFEGLYENVTACHFSIQRVVHQNDAAAIYWTMRYQHPKLNQGQEIAIQGSSHIQGEGDKVIYHRDYLDLGAMLYEHLPLVGRLIKWIKARAAK